MGSAETGSGILSVPELGRGTASLMDRKQVEALSRLVAGCSVFHCLTRPSSAMATPVHENHQT